MPKIKRDVRKAEERTVSIYDGDYPPDGVYRARITSARLRTWPNAGTDYMNFGTVLDAKNKDGEHAAYDGYNHGWAAITIDQGNEISDAKEKSLYLAIAGKALVDIDVDDKVQGDPVITKIGGVNPVGRYVFLRLKTERSEQYGNNQRGEWIYPDPGSNGGETVEAEETPEDDAELDAEAEAKPVKRTRKAPAKSNVTPIKKADPEPEAEEPDFDSMTLPQVRQAALAAGIDIKGVGKKDLIAQLKAAMSGVEGERQLNPQDIQKMSEEDLTEYLNTLYEEGDTDGMSRKDIIELLVEDGHILPI